MKDAGRRLHDIAAKEPWLDSQEGARIFDIINLAMYGKSSLAKWQQYNCFKFLRRWTLVLTVNCKEMQRTLKGQHKSGQRVSPAELSKIVRGLLATVY